VAVIASAHQTNTAESWPLFHTIATAQPYAASDGDISFRAVGMGQEISAMKIHSPSVVLLSSLTLICTLSTAVNAEESQGKVKVVLVDHVTIIVTDKARNDQLFRLSEHAKVLIDDREGKLGDLKPGDQVAIIWNQRDNRKMASLITCKKEWLIGDGRLSPIDLWGTPLIARTGR
jgi:hypothetical protein